MVLTAATLMKVAVDAEKVVEFDAAYVTISGYVVHLLIGSMVHLKYWPGQPH